MIQEHIKRPLSEELLFGKLAHGGVVRVDVEDGLLTFSFPETPAPGGKNSEGGNLPATTGKSPVPAVVK